MKTRAAVHLEHGQPLIVDEIELPDPAPDQVVIKQFASGVCHTQIFQMHNQDSVRPLLLGHESTGVVVAKGAAVTHVQEGDRVMVTWVPRAAEEGFVRPDPVVISFRGREVSAGVFTWAESTIAHEQYVVKLADDVVTDVTSIIGCAVMTGVGAALNTAQVSKNSSVAVYGAGGIGLSIIQGCAIAGVEPLIVVDVTDEKLEFARQFGATVGINALSENPVERIRELTGGIGADFAFDAVGLQVTMEQLVSSIRPGVLGVKDGGMAVLVGFPQTTATLNMRDLFFSRTYRGTLGGSSRPQIDLPKYVDWFREGKLKLDLLVTNRYRLDDINQACADLDTGKILGRAIIEFE